MFGPNQPNNFSFFFVFYNFSFDFLFPLSVFVSQSCILAVTLFFVCLSFVFCRIANQVEWPKFIFFLFCFLLSFGFCSIFLLCTVAILRLWLLLYCLSYFRLFAYNLQRKWQEEGNHHNNNNRNNGSVYCWLSTQNELLRCLAFKNNFTLNYATNNER